jgi:hypothetical protein
VRLTIWFSLSPGRQLHPSKQHNLDNALGHNIDSRNARGEKRRRVAVVYAVCNFMTAPPQQVETARRGTRRRLR